MNKLEQLRTELEKVRKELNDKGYHYDPSMYDKQGYNELMKIKPFEIKYQEVIENIWPDEAWWKVLNYWDIFDAMAFGGLDDEKVIDEIVKHVSPEFLEESCELKEESDEAKSIKELESKYKCKFESGHKLSDWMRKYHEEYDNGELWDYSLEDFKSGAVEPQEGLVYYLIKDGDGSLRAYETTEFCEECSESLNEGTSNFGRLRNFPLLVFYTIDEIYDKMKYHPDYPQMEDFTTDKGNGDFHVDYDAYYEACDKFEEEYWDKIETAVLDESQQEELEDAIYAFNEETEKIANDLYDADNEDDYYNLKDIKVSIEPGYYEAAYVAVENEKDFEYLSDEVKEAQLKRFKEFFDKLKNEHHLSHYEIAWGPASNGETGYRKVESLKEEEGKIEVYCYSKEPQLFDSRDKAIAFYKDAQRNSEGSEQERYTNVLLDLEDGLNIAWDQVVNLTAEVQKKYDAQFPEESLKEDYSGEYTDVIAEVLDNYGILYGDIVDNGDKINIVGVDEFEWEEAQQAIQDELDLEVVVPPMDHEENDDELIVIKSVKESKKKDDCHVNKNAGDPVKNAEFFNANMGTSGEGAVGEDLEESKEEGKSLDDIDADKDDKKELAKQEYEKEVDDADADRDDKLEKEKSLKEETKEQVNENLIVTTDDVTVHVDPVDAVTTVESSEGSVVVQHSNGDVTVSTDSGVTVNTSEGATEVDVNKVEEVTAEVVPELGVQDAVVSDEVVAPVEGEPVSSEEEIISNEEEPVVAEESLKEDKLTEEPVHDLGTRYDSRNSFYGKAKVDSREDGSQILYSYDTPVCMITKDGEVKLLRKGYLGWFSSQTTLRHVKEFLQQNGKEIGSKAQLAKMYPTEDAYDYVK